MTRLQLIGPDGQTTTALHDDAAAAALQRLGIASGRLPLRERPVSSLPQLTYARELLGLQQRFGRGRIQRVRLRRVASPLPMPAADGDEICVVLQGSLHIALDAGGHGAAVSVEAGEWVAMPRGLARTAVPAAQPTLDLLRLHTEPAAA